jgi:glycosyltransferase involved in cell wall biosynthesis
MDLPQERMSAMYGTADVFVSAEHRAGWSNTCAEAAACGLPLVCTSSGTEDFAVEGENAFVVRRSAGAIRRALERLYSDRSLGGRMGGRSARMILDFTWDRVCARMSEQFREITGQ